MDARRNERTARGRESASYAQTATGKVLPDVPVDCQGALTSPSEVVPWTQELALELLRSGQLPEYRYFQLCTERRWNSTAT